MTTISEKYRIVYDTNDPKKWSVELLASCAPFHGLLISFGKFSVIKGGEDDQNPRISFETDILYVPERLRGVDLPDEEEDKMQVLLTQILFDIVENNLSKTKTEDGKLYLELCADDK